MNPARLTAAEFDAHLAAGTLRLAFVGMSNAGKSYRSNILKQQKDFFWYCVDQEIQKGLGLGTEADVSSWMGYPSSKGYAEREADYLELENAATHEAAVQTGGKNLVFDTTGSVVHLRQETLNVLANNCLVVYLAIDEAQVGEMIEKFFANPKPVAWAGNFTMQAGESENDALRRCYPALLKQRSALYEQLAHVRISAKSLKDATGDKTLELIRAALV